MILQGDENLDREYNKGDFKGAAMRGFKPMTPSKVLAMDCLNTSLD